MRTVVRRACGPPPQRLLRARCYGGQPSPRTRAKVGAPSMTRTCDLLVRSGKKGVNRGQRETAAPHFSAGFSLLGQHQNSASRSRLSVICQSRLSFHDLSYMPRSTVSVRELQQNLKRVMARVERGETVEVTRRRRPIARLTPATSAGPIADWPDLDARTRSVFGDRIVNPAGLDVVIDNRGER